MASTVTCQHCGEEHGPDVRRCPKSGDLMSESGPCGGRIDRYDVKKLLGVGGFGAVYRAVHSRTGAHVALKVLKRQRAQDSAAVERFMREARAAALLGSEHIARVLDADVTPDGLPFIAMELLEGMDLSELDKERGPIAPERLVNIMIQALSALQLAHDKGIVHRDMKPANVFITRQRDGMGIERDLVKLLDFGISKIQATGERALTLAGTTMGTPAYMAYEQFFDARSVDGRADIYSVCAILYELLSRQRPYLANSYGELVMKVEKETPRPLKDVAPMLPDALCTVIDKGLKKDREERWQSARELAESLGQIGSLRGVAAKTLMAFSVEAVEAPMTRTHLPLTTEPRGKEAAKPVARGEVKTVLMDASLYAEAAAQGATPAAGSGAVPPGNDTLVMHPGMKPTFGVVPMEPQPSPPSPRAVGNATVLMAEMPAVMVAEAAPAAAPVPAPEPSAPSPAQEAQAAFVGNDTMRVPGRMMNDPERDRITQPRPQLSSPGGPFGLGWKLVGALGMGGLIVIGMAIWVLMLARRGH
ncbi:MAG: serine/threonine protein kinase [Archangiaceae bacterium]|nr:serine/threonine protein kinase [Archangiaceae bacterium]